MNASRLWLGALALSLCACQSARVEVPPADQSTGEEIGTASTAPASADRSKSAVAAAGAKTGHGLSENERAILKSDRFQRSLAEALVPENELEPTVDEDEREQLSQIANLLGDGKAKEAASLAAGFSTPTSSAQIDFMEGYAHYELEHPNEAKQAFRNAVNKFPKYRRAWKMLATLHYSDGEFGKAVESVSRVIKYGVNEPEMFGMLGASELRREDWVAAESAFRQAIMLDPENADWKMGLAQALLQQGDFASAATLVGTMLRSQPENPKLWRLQGEALARGGEVEQAIQNFEFVASLGAADGRLLNNLGSLYAKQELYESAAQAYLRALDMTEGRPAATLTATKFLSYTNATDATRELIAGLEKRSDVLTDEDKVELLRIRSRIATAEERDEDALEILREVVRLDPADGQAMLRLGTAARRAGELDKAKMWFERAQAIEKFEADAKVSLAQVLVKEENYSEAVRLLESAQQIRPRDSVEEFLDKVRRAMGRR